jgi:asparaginyl-tRNA synthetase
MQTQEELITYICRALCTDVSEELTLLLGSTERIAQINAPFPKITYEEAIMKLHKVGYNVCWGETLTWKLEQKLSSMFNTPFFIYEFPITGETLLHRTHTEKTELSICADLFAPEGYGEIASAAEATTSKKELKEKLKELNIAPQDRQWYMSLKRFNLLGQSGFAIGLERLLWWLCKLDNIRETSLFPRMYSKVYP